MRFITIKISVVLIPQNYDVSALAASNSISAGTLTVFCRMKRRHTYYTAYAFILIDFTAYNPPYSVFSMNLARCLIANNTSSSQSSSISTPKSSRITMFANALASNSSNCLL